MDKQMIILFPGTDGRRADGNASRGVNLNSIYMGAKIGDMGLDAHQSFSVSAWLRIDKIFALIMELVIPHFPKPVATYQFGAFFEKRPI